MNKDSSLCRFSCGPSSMFQRSSLKSDEEADWFHICEVDTTPRILPNDSFPKQADDGL